MCKTALTPWNDDKSRFYGSNPTGVLSRVFYLQFINAETVGLPGVTGIDVFVPSCGITEENSQKCVEKKEVSANFALVDVYISQVTDTWLVYLP